MSLFTKTVKYIYLLFIYGSQLMAQGLSNTLIPGSMIKLNKY